MKLLFLLFTLFPAVGFGQLSNERLVGKWCGFITTTTKLFPDGVKRKDTLIINDTIKAEFVFKPDNTATLEYKSNSKDFEKAPPSKIKYQIMPDTIVKFVRKGEKTFSKFYLKNDALYFQPYPPSEALHESIELFYEMGYVRCK